MPPNPDNGIQNAAENELLARQHDTATHHTDPCGQLYVFGADTEPKKSSRRGLLTEAFLNPQMKIQHTKACQCNGSPPPFFCSPGPGRDGLLQLEGGAAGGDGEVGVQDRVWHVVGVRQRVERLGQHEPQLDGVLLLLRGMGGRCTGV